MQRERASARAATVMHDATDAASATTTKTCRGKPCLSSTKRLRCHADERSRQAIARAKPQIQSKAEDRKVVVSHECTVTYVEV